MENINENNIIMIEAQEEEKKYSAPEILQLFNTFLQVRATDVIKIDHKNNEQIWGSTLYEGDTVLFDSGIIFPSKSEARADVMYKYLKLKNFLNFPKEHKKSTPKIPTAPCNPKNILDTYLQKLNITPTINFISPEFTCIISINYKEKYLQSQSQKSANKSIASYDAAKDMLKQLSFFDEEAMKIYRRIDENYFRFGTSAPFEENAEIELKASNFLDLPNWGMSELQYTLKGNGNVNRSFSNYVCAFLNSKKGGSIYYGIYDIGSIAYGYLLSEKERDQLTQSLSKILSNSFYPLVDTLVSFYFHPVEVAEEVKDGLIQSEEEANKKELKGEGDKSIPQRSISDLKKRFILEISVAKDPPAPVYWYNNSAFEKIENSISLMRAELIYSRIVSHAQSKPLLN